MQPVPEHEIFTKVDSYAKVYPRMTKLFVFNHPTKVRKAGYEPTERTKHMHSTQSKDRINPVAEIDSMRRTKTRLSDIVISNNFDLFCTFTFAKDRQNVDLLKRQMSRWLNNQQTRAGKFSYLIVPEFHKDGKSIHFHALFKGYRGELINTGHRTKRGQISFVIKSYTLGYSTAVKINPDEIEKVGSYVKKYITKDMPQFSGKKRYWCSHGLERPLKIMNPVIFPSEAGEFSDPYPTRNMQVYVSEKRIDLYPAI